MPSTLKVMTAIARMVVSVTGACAYACVYLRDRLSAACVLVASAMLHEHQDHIQHEAADSGRVQWADRPPRVRVASSTKQMGCLKIECWQDSHRLKGLGSLTKCGIALQKGENALQGIALQNSCQTSTSLQKCGIALQRHRDRLGLRVVFERVRALLTADAGLLETAEWSGRVEYVVCVHPDGARPEGTAHPVDGVHVLAEDTCGEAIVAVIAPRNHLLLIAPLRRAHHG